MDHAPGQGPTPAWKKTLPTPLRAWDSPKALGTLLFAPLELPFLFSSMCSQGTLGAGMDWGLRRCDGQRPWCGPHPAKPKAPCDKTQKSLGTHEAFRGKKGNLEF